ncbi:MAG: hypothetical protein IKL42_02075 [Clostridia bacterium]|nr:hypothetical protein [Clostridia bacterium]
MNNLKVGFCRMNIDPPMGVPVRGYYKERFVEGILDSIYMNVLALKSGDNTILLINIDNCGIDQKKTAVFKEIITKRTGVPSENIMIASTHTHTAPEIDPFSDDELIKTYTELVKTRFADASAYAIADLKDAKMGYGKGVAPNVAFGRRYLMKDGSTKTNPGVNNPDIVRAIGVVDDSVNVIRFDREGADTIVFVNFANHPDVVGGSKVSGDWPALLRTTVEKVLDNTKCIFFNGAQGDVNHVNVHPKPGDLNGMFMDFDDVSRGYSHAEYIARVVTGGVLQAYDKVNYVDVDSVLSIIKPLNIQANKGAPKDMPEAHRINDLHNAGRDNELPYEGMMLTTIVAEAARMVRLENGPDTLDMSLTGIKIGPVAIIGIPGEPFTKIGLELKDTDGFDMILPCCAANGYEGYFPMQDSYDEGGYEARTSRFKAGTAEYVIKEGKALLESLRK